MFMLNSVIFAWVWSANSIFINLHVFAIISKFTKHIVQVLLTLTLSSCLRTFKNVFLISWNFLFKTYGSPPCNSKILICEEFWRILVLLVCTGLYCTHEICLCSFPQDKFTLLYWWVVWLVGWLIKCCTNLVMILQTTKSYPVSNSVMYSVLSPP